MVSGEGVDYIYMPDKDYTVDKLLPGLLFGCFLLNSLLLGCFLSYSSESLGLSLELCRMMIWNLNPFLARHLILIVNGRLAWHPAETCVRIF